MPTDTATPTSTGTDPVNALLASGAAHIAQLLAEHHGPPLGGVSLDMLGLDPDTPSPVRVNLQVGRTQPLADFLAWTDLLAEVDEYAHTTVTPRAGYLSLDTHIYYHELRVIVWTHITGPQFTAVWEQLSPPPSLETIAAISVEALRAAAEVSS